MVCKAISQFGDPLNDVDVEITGPEGPYTGTITEDSLVFTNVPYGMYEGYAYQSGNDPVYATDEMNATNHYIIFLYDDLGINHDSHLPGKSLSVSPNPFSDNTVINVELDERSIITLRIYNQNGQLVRTLAEGNLDPGKHQFYWNGNSDSGQSASPGVYSVVLQGSEGRMAKSLIRIP
jgi:hypothetical protein